MSLTPDQQQMNEAISEARKVCQIFRLPFAQLNWRGSVGNWSGAGIGSSIDYQDHRPYVPGDDPRHIDWLAYARSGQHVMKLYREEVSPRLDLVVDVSTSMFYDRDKLIRVLEVVYFCFESALRSAASFKVHLIRGSSVAEQSHEAFSRGDWTWPERIEGKIHHPTLITIPWRPGSVRILISDLLFESEPESMLATLNQARCQGVVLAPFTAAESDPDWEGYILFKDCETEERSPQWMHEDERKHYGRRYQQHFCCWREASRKYQVRLAQLRCEGSLADALKEEPLKAGIIETWG